MATGPEHYQRAEIAQDAAAALQASRPGGPDFTATEALLDALVHATLALAGTQHRIARLEDRVRVLEEADDTDGLADRIAEIERRGIM